MFDVVGIDGQRGCVGHCGVRSVWAVCRHVVTYSSACLYSMSCKGLANLSWYILVPRPLWCAVLARGSRDTIRAQCQWFWCARPWRCAPLVVASPARSQFASCCS